MSATAIPVPQRLFVVLDREGLSFFCAETRTQANDHINDRAVDFPDIAGRWIVREFAPVTSREAGKAQSAFLRAELNALLRAVTSPTIDPDSRANALERAAAALETTQ